MKEMKINWKLKFSSRKFQVAIVAIVVPLLALFKVDLDTQTQIIALISSILAAIAYIFAEAHVDAARESAPQFLEIIEHENIKRDATLENHGGETPS